MQSERNGLAQTPRQLRLGATCMVTVAVALGVFGVAAGKPIFWGFVVVFSAWSIHMRRLAARWSKEDNDTLSDLSSSS
ncbi:hypothetical protein BA895_22880 [Humibacillus sp. DSM 29435]|uniref:hypothetical protein n=1 Tax=Humibacillus sp. DSM 29435 TaxID=1869167 RepID=UPI000872E4CF|nr:hypothetical protein [Humibacillus sp. DSM 29435]OFE14912.1 hypothetical protein BA895_22880 [Humibacillus sp. DSM 29435]